MGLKTAISMLLNVYNPVKPIIKIKLWGYPTQADISKVI
ncbi:hypothetical protein NIES4103_06740 [Nostoc sp. NIES-4103]|nr:hypothetical protein NIES4103_06740 [Nostoc sp. NIES-4103]